MSKPGENPETSRRDDGTLRFGPFALDGACRRLTRGAAAIHLTPKAFDLLHVLATEAPRVVGKRELHERLWPDSFVSDASLVELAKELRRALDDRSPEAPVIRTAHRVGYALALDVDVTTPPRPRGRHWLVFRDRRIALICGRSFVFPMWEPRNVRQRLRGMRRCAPPICAYSRGNVLAPPSDLNLNPISRAENEETRS